MRLNDRMRRVTPKILDVLAESLEVYFRILRRSADQLLTVLVPMAFVYALAVSWYCGGKSASAGPFGFLKTVMWLTAGLAVVTAVAEKTYRHCRGIEVWNDPGHGPGGYVGSWKRLMVTSWLQFLLVFVWVAVMAVSLVAGSYVVSSPFAELGGVAYGLSVVLGVVVVAAAVLAGLWFICRWIFAPVMSVVRHVSGFSALGMSADFVRGRMLRCALFFVASILVVSGLTAVPSLAKDSLTSGGVPKDWFGMAKFIMTEVTLDILGLYSVTALMVFWRRTEDAERGIAVKPPLRRSKILVVLLAVAGVAFLVWAVSAGGERHEREKRNPERTVSWEEIKFLRAASAPDDADDNEFVTVLPDFDAATITGEELQNLKGDGRYLLDQRQYVELQRRLVGRELTFAELTVSGWHECPISKAYYLHFHPLVGRVDLTVRFETPEQETRARKVWKGRSSMLVKRLVGKVLPFDPSQVGSRGLFMSVVDIEWDDRPAPSVGSSSSRVRGGSGSRSSFPRFTVFSTSGAP